MDILLHASKTNPKKSLHFFLIVDAYFRRTGLERSEGLSKDLEWFSQQNLVIPPPSDPGISYAQCLEEIAEKSAPLFLCHFYNIYFSHIAGGQVIARRVCLNLHSPLYIAGYFRIFFFRLLFLWIRLYSNN